MTFSEKDCLACNPFEGDYGEVTDRKLKDKIVTARKSRECSLCLTLIEPGERIRVMVEIASGEFFSHAWQRMPESKVNYKAYQKW